MNFEGIESFGGTAHRESKEMMATIEDLQRSQVAMWEKFQSLPKKMENAVCVDARPPYLEDMAGKLYLANYTPLIFPKYDDITRNARERIRWYVDMLIAYSYDHELRLREFSKSLEGRAFTWFRDLSLLCHDPVEEERLVDVCIAGMLYEYRPYLENLQISSFTILVEAVRRTSMSVRKPSKGSTSQTVNAPRQLWRRENKKVEVAVIEEPKKVAKGKKRDRGISRERIIPEPMQVAEIRALQQNTLRRVSLDLRVGPIRAPTFMHGMEGNTSYHTILGHLWLKAHKAVASTYHQCVKAIWRNKPVVIEATKMPFDRVELHFVEADLYQEYEPEGKNRILPFNSIALQAK
nr:hypothetical protein CFP56_58990 [Quercus suber]